MIASPLLQRVATTLCQLFFVFKKIILTLARLWISESWKDQPVCVPGMNQNCKIFVCGLIHFRREFVHDLLQLRKSNSGAVLKCSRQRQVARFGSIFRNRHRRCLLLGVWDRTEDIPQPSEWGWWLGYSQRERRRNQSLPSNAIERKVSRTR